MSITTCFFEEFYLLTFTLHHNIVTVPQLQALIGPFQKRAKLLNFRKATESEIKLWITQLQEKNDYSFTVRDFMVGFFPVFHSTGCKHIDLYQDTYLFLCEGSKNFGNIWNEHLTRLECKGDIIRNGVLYHVHLIQYLQTVKCSDKKKVRLLATFHKDVVAENITKKLKV